MPTGRMNRGRYSRVHAAKATVPCQWQRLIYQHSMPRVTTAETRPFRQQKSAIRYQARNAAHRRAPPDPARGFQATWLWASRRQSRQEQSPRRQLHAAQDGKSQY